MSFDYEWSESCWKSSKSSIFLSVGGVVGELFLFEVAARVFMDDIIGTPKANMNRLGSSLQVKNTKLFLKAKDYIFLPFNTPVTLETTVK